MGFGGGGNSFASRGLKTELAYSRVGASVGDFDGMTATLGRQRGYEMNLNGALISQGLLYDNSLSAGSQVVDPEVRSNFADTALWLPDIALDTNGKAQADITFPQSLTTWKLHGYALTGSTQVGDATAVATTTKNLLVRLQSPRFFTERDEVVLSANVHNYLKGSKKVRAELLVPASLFENLTQEKNIGAPDADGNVHLLAEKVVQADGEARFDWPVKVLKAGLARYHRQGAHRRGKRRGAYGLSGSGAWN